MILLAVLVGVGSLVPFVLQAWRDVRIAYFYRPTTCSVVSSSTYTTTTRFRINGNRNQYTAHPEFTYQLEVDGRWHTVVGFDNMDGRTSDPSETLSFRAGQSYPCWYDPWSPDHAVLRRAAYKPFYFGLIIPALFLLIGGNMLVRSLRPVPVVPLEGRSTGDALAVRLQPEMTGARAAGCLAAAVIVWTTGVVALFAYLIRSGRLFNGDGLTTLALILAAIGAFLAFHLVRTLRFLGVPEPDVEIDHEPLRPGESAKVFLRQKGPVHFASFEVALACEEQGQKGTRTRHRHALMKRTDVAIAAAADLTESLTIAVPADAPVSIRELQTIVTWKIIVRRKAAAGNADREFVFRVADAAESSSHVEQLHDLDGQKDDR